MGMNIYETELHCMPISRRQSITVKQIVVWMLSATMLIDFTNGMLSGYHIGEILRVILLLVCSIYIFTSGKREKNIYLGIIMYLFLNVLIASALYSRGLMTNVSMAMKSSILFAVFFTLITMNKKDSIGLQDVESIIKNNLYYAPGIFILSFFLGVGKSSYSFGGQSLGFKSGFLSLNSINIAFMVLYIFCIDKVFKTTKVKWIFYSLYVAVPMAMLGTKTSYAIIIAVPVLFVLLSIKRNRTWKIMFAAGIAVILLAYPFVVKILPLFQGIIDRQKTLFSQRTLWTYLTSTRNLRIRNVLSYYLSNSNMFNIVFGSGYYWIHNIAAGMEITVSDVIPLEMDWADLFVTYGIVGMLFPYVYIFNIIRRYHLMSKIGRSGSAYYWITLIVLLYGTVAGHLFFEAISSTFYGIVLAGLCIAGKDKESFTKKIGYA